MRLKFGSTEVMKFDGCQVMHKPFLNLAMVATAIWWLLLQSVSANDQCSGAVALVSGVTNAVNTSTATTTGDPKPNCADDGGKGVWYTVTPASSGTVTMSTCGSDFDTVLGIYTGSCGDLVQLTCDDDGGCGGRTSAKSFSGIAGTTYYILAGGYEGASGNLKIFATLPPSVPANDHCSNAVALVSGVTNIANTTPATTTGDPKPNCAEDVGKGVWYTVTPVSSGTVAVSTCGSDFDTALGIYTGSCSALVQLTCDDDGGCGNKTSAKNFSGIADTTYYILAGGYDGASGNLKIMATLPPPVPVNDLCSNAVALVSGMTNAVNTSTATATDDPKPNCAPNVGKGVWYTVTPGSNGTVTVSTCGSDFDTALGIYTGSCGALVQIACDDDGGCGGHTSSKTFSGIAGTTYFILAGGYDGASGNLKIMATIPPSPFVPRLSFARIGNSLVLSWPTNDPFYQLYFATNLPATTWAANPVAPSLAGGQYSVTNRMTNGPRIYQLRK